MKSIISISIIAMCASVMSAQSVELTNPAIKIELDNSSGDVQAYLVSDNGSNRMTSLQIKFEENQTEQVDGTISLNTADRRQDIDGFGFAITGSAAYNLRKMKPEGRKAILTRIFSRERGYGCNFVRVPIGCSDFSLSEYTCWDDKDKGFALTGEETNYIIPVMKEILSINPDVKVLSSPWTAPRWMKTNGGWTSGNLKRECYGDYADYFVRWIQSMQANGINIYAVTQQNEPLNHGNSASMFMGWDEARDFAKVMGPKFREAGLNTKIFVFDHNYNYDNNGSQSHYPAKIYDDAEASQYVAGAAYHNYGGNASEMSYIHNLYPGKELVFTEWTAGTWSWPGVGIEAVTSDAQALIFDVVNNWGRGSLVWNLMLDSDRGPNRPGGCVTGNGAVDIDKNNYENITYNSFYYVMCVAASAVSDNAVHVGTDGWVNDVQCVAFDNTDGYGVVLMNTSNDRRKVRISHEGRSFVTTLPGKTLASCRWNE